MVPKINNRYALFGDGDVNPSLLSSPVDSSSRNPFLNQVADDSGPWQEVKKRGAPAVQPTAPRGKMRHDHARARTASASTMENRETAYDPHENWCGVCSQKFSSKSTLLAHIKQAEVDHKNYCNLCKRVFKDRNGLKNHLENSYGHEVYCNMCLSAFNDEWGLKNHFENNYAVSHEYVCLTCLQVFRSRVELEQHLQTASKHTGCGTCSRRFRNQDERDEHWQKTTKHKHCLQPGCDYDGPDQVELDRHLAQDHYQCVGCKCICPSQTKYNLHMETCSFAIACHQCGQLCDGQAQLALHLQACFYCTDCGFQTTHEGNYKVHMTKHASATISCWGCEHPMRTYSSLINHLELGKCPSFSNPSRFILCLGMWWYSPLYMDLDLHANLRTGRVNVNDMRQWMDDGVLAPFMCRHEACGKTFGHLSSLVLHCESHACGWDIARLNMPGLEAEFKRFCLRRNSGMA